MLSRWTWVVPLAALCALTGCGKESTGEGGAPQGGVSKSGAPAEEALASVTGADLDGVKAPSRRLKLALIVKTRNNPFFDPMIRAAVKEAQVLGADLEVQAPPQESDKELQFSMVQNVAAKGVDAILIAPADSKGIVPALKAASDRGILVINVDNRLDKPTCASTGMKLAGYVGADNEAGGKLAGEAMVAALNGSGNVAVIEGIRGADNAESRKRGFDAGVDKKLNVVVSDSAEWDTQKAYAKFQSVLAAQKDLKGVFCANDKMALGAMKALRESGRKGQVTVIGYDNIPDVQPYLASGEMYGTIEQHPDLMGKYGVRTAVGILGGSLKRGIEYLVPLEVMRKH